MADNRMAHSLEEIARHLARSKRVSEDEGARQREQKRTKKVFHELWWTGNLMIANGKFDNPDCDNSVFVNGKKTSETIKEVLDRLQGTVVTQGVFSHDGLWARCITVEVEAKE